MFNRQQLMNDLKARKNHPRVILLLRTDLGVDALRWPGMKDLEMFSL